jgi:hypothetical protein
MAKRTHGQTPSARAASLKKYNAKPASKKARASNNAARAKMIKAGKARKGDGKDVDHKNSNPLDNRKSNLRLRSRSANRSDNKKGR